MHADTLTLTDPLDTVLPKVVDMAAQDVRQTRSAFLQALQTRKRELSTELRTIEAQINALQAAQTFVSGPRRRGPRQGDSIKTRVEQLLLAHGSPMHASDIVDALRAAGVSLSEKDPRAVVVTAARRLEKEGRAKKTGPNTYEAVKQE